MHSSALDSTVLPLKTPFDQYVGGKWLALDEVKKRSPVGQWIA